MVHIGHIVSKRGIRMFLSLGLLAAGGAVPDLALAQRPFAVHDPFYRGETARRPFYDGYAFTTEVSYRSPGQSIRPDPLGLSFRLEYQISPKVDIGGVLDAAGSNTGRTISLSWLTFKYYETEENTDYAFRLAVDPATDGRLGNPQVDAAFLSTTLLTPNLSTDYAVGLRRVRLGYEEITTRTVEFDGSTAIPERPTLTDITYTRALGWEFHSMAQYSLLLNPARSNVFVSGLLYLGQYDIVETSLNQARVEPGGTAPATPDEILENAKSGETDEEPREHNAGAIWIRSGFEYNRPGFQIMPFMSYAVRQWAPASDNRPARLSFGLRFMLR